MGWNLRRSVNFGPLRINLSKSGLGYSVGARGFRVGTDARGRRYWAISIPGTGVYRRDYFDGVTQQTTSTPNQAAPALRPRSSTRIAWPFYVGGAILLYILIRAVF